MNNKSDQTIVFAHGLGANKGNFLEYAKIFYNLGYNVFIFDFRGHGNSGGHTISFGYNEKNDILGASEYLKKYYPTKTKKLFGVGYSMGAASIIFAQSDYKIFDKIIIDSSYAYSSNMIDSLYKYLPNYYRIYLKNISDVITQYNIGVAISNINPADKIESIDVPILLFHGKKDSIIPYNESILLKEKIILKNKENKLYLFNNSDHVSGIIDEYDIYLDKVINFLKK
ncbi:MAG: alpha/beta hydrolase [Candidatus Altimarinota bacterium]